MLLNEHYDLLYNVCSQVTLPETLSEMREGILTPAYNIHERMCVDHPDVVDLAGEILVPFKPQPVHVDHRRHITTLQMMGSFLTYCIIHDIGDPTSVLGILGKA